jgi:hypothetical protein
MSRALNNIIKDSNAKQEEREKSNALLIEDLLKMDNDRRREEDEKRREAEERRRVEMEEREGS